MYKKHILFVHKLGPVLIWSYLAHISHTALAVITHLLLTDCFINCYCLFPTSCEVRMTQRGKCCRILKTMWREVKKKSWQIAQWHFIWQLLTSVSFGKKKRKTKAKKQETRTASCMYKKLGKEKEKLGKGRRKSRNTQLRVGQNRWQVWQL